MRGDKLGIHPWGSMRRRALLPALFWQLPQPHGYQLSDVDVVDATTAWAVGDDTTVLSQSDTVLRSGDGGMTWEPNGTGSPDFVAAVDFTSAADGWVVGAGLFHTPTGATVGRM